METWELENLLIDLTRESSAITHQDNCQAATALAHYIASLETRIKELEEKIK